MFQNKAKFSPPNFTLYPLTWLAICFAAGICLGNLFEFSWPVYLFVCLLFSILTLIFIKQNFVFVPLLLAFVSVGGLCFQVEKQSVEPNRLKNLYDNRKLISGDPIVITGIVQGQ